MNRRITRVNSLLKEVISDTIRKDVKNPHLPELITITSVDVTKDLKLAKVYVSIIGEKKEEAIKVLNQAAGFIAVSASKQVDLRYFPELTFYIDDSVDKQMKIEEVLTKINKEKEARD